MEVSSPVMQVPTAVMQTSPTSLHLQPFQLISGAITFDAGQVKIETTQQFLAQVLRILTQGRLVELKILKTSEVILLKPSVAVNPGQLVLLSPTKSEIQLQTSQLKAAEQLFRLLMPRQGLVKDALASMLRAAAAERHPRQQAPDENIDQLVKKVIRQLPRHQDVIKPKLLQQVIKSSGLIPLDVAHPPPKRPGPAGTTSLNHSSPPMAARPPQGQPLLLLLKALLQPIAGVKRNIQAEPGRGALVKDAAEALARVILSQIKPIRSLEGDDVEIRRTEVVTRGDHQLDSFQVQFLLSRPQAERQWDSDEINTSGKKESGRKWTVKLNFDFPTLGKITSFIYLTCDRHLEMNFWSNRPKTYALIKSKRHALRKRLQRQLLNQGVDSLKIEVFEGEAPSNPPLVASHLINEVA